MDGTGGARTAVRSPWLMLAVATIGFAVNFWAWALLSPLGPLFRTQGTLGTLTESDVALLVAVPVLVGSLGRIPIGALTDRYGGRVMFPLVSAATIVPILFIEFFALDSYAALLVGGFFLGIGGTAFAVGVPFVNAWFPPERRGLAIGIFGAGMGGTAISALTTVKLYSNAGHQIPFLLTAISLAAYAVIAWFVLRDAPNRRPAQGGFVQRLVANAKLPISWQACILYAVAFGGYVAFSVYLPSYLKTAYDLNAADAANRMAGFVVVAVVMRPVGGWLSDKFHPVLVLTGCFTIAAVLAVLASAQFPLIPLGTVAFLGLAAVLGGASGGCFALVARVAPAEKVGGVTGIVGAAGGLGGFVPPLVMGAVYGATDSYRIGLLLLGVVALTAAAYTWFVMRREART